VSKLPARRPALNRLGAALAVFSLAALGACAPSSNGGDGTSADDQQTITFWHGWSQDTETAAIDANIAKFEELHPNIEVKTVGAVTDDKILQGIRGADAPDVVSSFNTLNVGAFCGGALVDLNPLMAKDGIDKDATYVRSMTQYSSYDGVQCTVPLLSDNYGLFYNTDMFAAAGIPGPPKTWTELQQDAVKLTKSSGDSYSQLGIMPNLHGYENGTGHSMVQWGATYFDADGKAVMSKDPAVTNFLTYWKGLEDSLGGYANLEKYRTTFGEEFSPENAFEAQKVAMQIDGEWRTQNLATDQVPFGWATAPMPVPDDRLDEYGRGWTSGTVVGIPARSGHQQAAWELVKFLTTDTDALVGLANAIHNVPSTHASLQSPDLVKDEKFQTFLDIAANPLTTSPVVTKDGDQYLQIFEDFAYRWESGEVTDLQAGLREVDQRIDAAMAQAGE
jgi:multiple sugar transport system substrate-binding protein